MQKQIVEKQKLLDVNGNIANPGYAKSLMWDYSRKDVKSAKTRIKEWDYYLINNNQYAIALTIADMGYIGALSLSYVNFETKEQETKSSIFLFPMGKLKMPETSVIGDASYTNGNVKFTFKNDGKVRRLFGEYPHFFKNKDNIKFDFTLTEEPKESMVIATPFKENKRFYYNQKINCLTVESGSFSIAGNIFELNKSNNALATLDWGRGCWTYDNTWYWGSLQTTLKDGKKFGFNIGYGFGDNSAATENMLFYNGKAHKLNDVVFYIPKKDGKEDYMSNWKFTSSDNRFEMQFEPIIDRYAPFNIGVICMIPHQVFGWFSGTATLDDGKVIKLNKVLGFAEKVHNKW